MRTSSRPAWTSDWITAEGRGKRWRHGIAPPHPGRRRGGRGGPVPLTLSRPGRGGRLPAVRFGRHEQTARSAPTACKALFRCRACREPFEYVKEI